MKLYKKDIRNLIIILKIIVIISFLSYQSQDDWSMFYGVYDANLDVFILDWATLISSICVLIYLFKFDFEYASRSAEDNKKIIDCYEKDKSNKIGKI